MTRCDWGVEMRKITAGTLVQENTLFDVRLPWIDNGDQNVLLDNRVEQPVWNDPPPAAGVDRQ
jgi:hypothetical protein